MVTPILDEHIEEIAGLAVECFQDDPFYSLLSGQENERREKIREIFRRSIGICIHQGYAFGVCEDGAFVAFSLWFNYEHLKSCCQAEFNHIFYGDRKVPESDDQFSFESKKIDETINGNREVLYLLAIAVAKTHRRKGFASEMIRVVQNAMPHLGIFADVSNQDSVMLYERLNFAVQEEVCGCRFVRYYSHQEDIPVISDEKGRRVWLAVPDRFDIGHLGISADQEETACVEFLQTAGDARNSYFRYSFYESSKIKLLLVSYYDLLKYQRYINVSFFDEIKYKIGRKIVVAYLTDRPEFPGLTDHREHQRLCQGKKEWDIIPDVYISIPVEYSGISVEAAMDSRKDESFLVNRILKALEFRTTYEAGVPTEKPRLKNGKDDTDQCCERQTLKVARELDNERFKYRIKRYYLGSVEMQILKEKTLHFNGTEDMDVPYGNPIRVEMVLSVDMKTRCGVLHLVALSCGSLITQLLDSVSRNQLYVKIDEGYRNLYGYLYSRFKIRKKGVARNFLTVMDRRDNIQDDLLASMLFCETLYEDGECLGKVVDEEVVAILSSRNGNAQYNYATVYTYRNILLQMSDSFQGKLYDRIYMESVTLFYIELILFEEAAIEIANDEIIRFLGTIDDYSPRNALKKINTVLSEHLKSIEFWNIQVNYPSSQKSIDDIRTAFHMDETRKMIGRNQKELQMIYEMRSDIVDKAEATFFSALGAIFTIISVMNFIADPNNHSRLLITFTIIFLTIGLYRYYLKTHIFYRETRLKKFWHKLRKK